MAGSDLSGIDYADSELLISPEILGVEGQDSLHVVGKHEGDQTGVMNLDA